MSGDLFQADFWPPSSQWFTFRITRRPLGAVPIVDHIRELPTNRKQFVGKQETDRGLDYFCIACRSDP